MKEEVRPLPKKKKKTRRVWLGSRVSDAYPVFDPVLMSVYRRVVSAESRHLGKLGNYVSLTDGHYLS